MSRFRAPVLLTRLISSSAAAASGSGVSSQLGLLSDAVRCSSALRQSFPLLVAQHAPVRTLCPPFVENIVMGRQHPKQWNHCIYRRPFLSGQHSFSTFRLHEISHPSCRADSLTSLREQASSGSFGSFASSRSFAAAAEERTASGGGREAAAARNALAAEEEPFSAITDKHIPQRPVSPVEATSYGVVIVAGGLRA